MRIYYGWVIVAIALVSFMLAIGASIQAYGLYVLPLAEAFGLSRAEVNTGAIVLNLGMAFSAPVIGRIVDKHSIRLVMAASALVFGVSYAVLGLSNNLWLSTIVLGLAVGSAVVGAGTVTSPVLVARWFTVHRGRAMGIATIGISLGAVVVIPVVTWLIEAMGWRQGTVALGIGVAAIMLVLAALTRDAPGPNDIEPGSQDASTPVAAEPLVAGTALSLGQLLRLPQFWVIVIATSLAFGVLTTNIVSIVPHVQAEGFTLTEAGTAMSIYGVAALAGALLFAWLGDRFNRNVAFAVVAAAIGLGSGGLLIGHGHVAILTCVVLMGLAGGGSAPAQLALLADRFGAASFGVATGAASFLATLITAVFLRLGGELFDRTGNYRLMFAVFAGVCAFSVVLMLAGGIAARRRAPA
jgi:MFS family permease